MTRVDTLIDPQIRSSLGLTQCSVSFLVSHAIPSSAQVSLDFVTGWLPLLSPPTHAVLVALVTSWLVLLSSWEDFYITVPLRASWIPSFDHVIGSFVEPSIWVLCLSEGTSVLFHSSKPSCIKARIKLHQSACPPLPFPIPKLTQTRTFSTSLLRSNCFPTLGFASLCLPYMFFYIILLKPPLRHQAKPSVLLLYHHGPLPQTSLLHLPNDIESIPYVPVFSSELPHKHQG